MKTLKNNAFLAIVLMTMTGAVVFIIMLVPAYRITSGSMEPTLPVGSVVFLGSADTLEEGDIITFQQEGEDHPTTHTFVGYADDGSLMTMGDANPTPDVYAVPLTHEDVIGKVVLSTPVLSLNFWLTQRGLLIVGFSLASLLVFWWSAQINKKEELQLENEETRDESHESSPV